MAGFCVRSSSPSILGQSPVCVLSTTGSIFFGTFFFFFIYFFTSRSMLSFPFSSFLSLDSGSEDSIRIFDLNYQPPLNKKQQKPSFQILSAHNGGAISDASKSPFALSVSFLGASVILFSFSFSSASNQRVNGISGHVIRRPGANW